MIIPTISAFLLVGQLVSAIPFAQVVRELPQDISHIALDEDNGQYLAYKSDGSLSGTYPADVKRSVVKYKRDGASCAKLSIEEAKELPGYHLLEEYADNTWGTGSRNVVTNPDTDDQRDGPATACVTTDVVQVELEGTPVCNNHTGKSEAKASGTEGEIEAEVEDGVSNTADWTITSGSTIGVSATVSATIGVPEVASGEVSATTSAEFTNEVTEGFSTTSSSMVKNKNKYKVPKDNMCHAEWQVSTCNASGRGNIRFLAGGWVWFEYEDRVDDHYKWAVSIENTIPNEDDRSSFMEFTGSITGESNSVSSAECEPMK